MQQGPGCATPVAWGSLGTASFVTRRGWVPEILVQFLNILPTSK